MYIDVCIYMYIYIYILHLREFVEGGDSDEPVCSSVSCGLVDSRETFQCAPTRARISHKVFLKSFCRSQHPHESAELFFTNTHIMNKLTYVCGN